MSLALPPSVLGLNSTCPSPGLHLSLNLPPSALVASPLPVLGLGTCRWPQCVFVALLPVLGHLFLVWPPVLQLSLTLLSVCMCHVADIKQWLNPQRLAVLISRGIELAHTRVLTVHNGEPEQAQSWAPSVQRCWALMDRYPALHTHMISSQCNLHPGHSCNDLLEWSDEKIQKCWGLDIPERRQLPEADAAPFVRF